MTLSAAGWPRPLVDGLPQPWIAPIGEFSQKDEHRQRRTAKGRICQVCGEKLTGRVFLCANVDDPNDHYPVGSRLPHGVGVHAMDHGLLHRHCLRLALRVCPELKRLQSARQLAVCEVPAGSIEAWGADVLILDPEAAAA